MNEKPTRLGRGLAALIGDMATLEGSRVTCVPATVAWVTKVAEQSGGRDGDPGRFGEQVLPATYTDAASTARSCTESFPVPPR